ncbi:hypothetical protein RD792_014075 [Penstemon davidsonii]|uniref:HMA domain-containing protein n=1 Tax=Penstemon davidsonii TaxID=160366 RepID=A0ABR0CPV2_9LAMI|nr:hypothetical protein RD792_014075 [Penstemon davidsonii]
MDIFCASQASTSICLSMEQQQGSSSSSSSSNSILLGGCGGGRAIDRYNPIIKDSRRIPCPAPLPPISPKPHHVKKKKKKNQKIPFKKENDDDDKQKKDFHDVVKNGGGGGFNTIRKSWSCTKPGGFISPPGSTRYLLSDRVVFKSLSDLDSDPKLVLEETTTSANKSHEVIVFKDLSDFDSEPKVAAVNAEELKEEKPPTPTEQVVVLRVSLHCRGCEKKMRKHISRMEGVTSFDIDFMAKKVTVTGKVTPLEVLSSISKVKNAQLWPPTISSSSNPQVDSSNSGIKNENKGAAGA